MKLSKILTILAYLIFSGGVLTIVISATLWLMTTSIFGIPPMLDNFISLASIFLGILLVLTAFRIWKSVKKATTASAIKKTITITILLIMITAPSYAINILDKFLYKKDILRSNNRDVLVNRITGEVKYIYRDDGQVVPIEGQWQEQYQKMYDAQNAPKKK